MNAITSAAVALQLAEACQKGEIKSCCMPPIRKIFSFDKDNDESWRDKETRFGTWITEYLTNIDISKLKKPKQARIAAIQHNNRIGRNVSVKIRRILVVIAIFSTKGGALAQ